MATLRSGLATSSEEVLPTLAAPTTRSTERACLGRPQTATHSQATDYEPTRPGLTYLGCKIELPCLTSILENASVLRPGSCLLMCF